ncbi:MAG: SDR family NAD(P)-dependent oxidoreductase [Desulfococcaceae bacterium]
MKPDTPSTPPVAIIGMGCFFPKAAGPKEFWRLLSRGQDAIIDAPPETHWQPADYLDENPKTPDHLYTTRGGYLSKIDFDPTEFGIPPMTLEATDTSQLLGLVAAKAALADAGYGEEREWNRDRTSVILGVTGTQELVIPLGARLGHPIWRRALKEAGVPSDQAEDVVRRISEGYVPWQEASFPGLLGNVVAGRITNRLNLGGTNCAVDAACASSMGAMHLALMELYAGRNDMVVAGGVDTLNDIFMHMCFTATPILSPTGDVRPFSRNADGTLLGEGVGIVILKRLEAAERDGDRIYAVIRALGSGSDGRSNSIYAPRAEGQAKALAAAYAAAGIPPQSVGLVEAHGTGTRVGDRVEFTALKSVFGEETENRIAVGTVKSMIGHAKAAAGAAGLIKAALSLYHKVLPPSLKIGEPDPELELDRGPLYLNTEVRPWVSGGNGPRRAGVSSFGFGGSNFHMVLEEHERKKSEVSWDGAVEILALSGADRAEVGAELETLRAELTGADDRAIHRIAAARREAFSPETACRLLIALEKELDQFTGVAETLQAAADRLTGAVRRPNGTGGIFLGEGDRPGDLGFVFPGQGSQYVNMGRDLVCRFPEAMEALEWAGPDIANAIFPEPAWSPEGEKEQADALRRTDRAQPAIGAISLAMTRILERFGVRPGAAAGHSFGELCALFAAGWIDAPTLLRLALARGRLMAEAGGPDAGSMLAVRGPLDEVAQWLEAQGLDLVLANRNSPEQGVLSGPTEEIDRADALLRETNWKAQRLPVSAAFHSRLMAGATAPFAETLSQAEITPTETPVYSNVTGETYAPDAAEVRRLLAEQLVSPVEFVREITALFQAGVRTFVEIGPKTVLSGLIRAILKGSPVQVLSADGSGGKGFGMTDLARLLCGLAALGYPVRLDQWEQPEPERRTPRMRIPLNGANYRSPKKGTKTKPPAKPPGGPSGGGLSPGETSSGTKAVPAPAAAAEARPPQAATPVSQAGGGVAGVAAAWPSSPAPSLPVSPTKPMPAGQRLPEVAGPKGQSRPPVSRPKSEAGIRVQSSLNASKAAGGNGGRRHGAPETAPHSPAQTEKSLGAGAPRPHAASKPAPKTDSTMAKVPGRPRTASPFRPSDARRAKSAPKPANPAAATGAPAGRPSSPSGVGRPTSPAPATDSSRRQPPNRAPKKPAAASVQPFVEPNMTENQNQRPESASDRRSDDLLADAFAAVREGLRSMQILQARTAETHSRFLETQAEANRILREMMAGTQRLAEASFGLGRTEPRTETVQRPEKPASPPETATPQRSEPATATKDAVSTQARPAATPTTANPPTGISSTPAAQPPVASPAYGTRTPEPSAPRAGHSAPSKPATTGPAAMAPAAEMPSAPEAEPASPPAAQTSQGFSSEATAPQASPAAAKPATAPAQPAAPKAPPAPEKTESAEPSSAGPDRQKLAGILVEVVSEQTGYPQEMLSLEMEIEADLGIDSIKRVEILSAFEEKMPGLPPVSPEIMGALKTLDQILDHLLEAAGSVPMATARSDNEATQSVQPEPASVPQTDNAISPEPAHAEAPTSPAQDTAPTNPEPTAYAPSEAADRAGERDRVVAALVEVVSEQTGYPNEMLSLEMEIEADLGIDSIKRVEILSAFEEKMPGLPPVSPEIMGTLKTLDQIVDHLMSAMGPGEGRGAATPTGTATATHPQAESPAAESPAPAEPVSAAPLGCDMDAAAREEVASILVDVVAEQTGYPEEMLSLDMEIEADLGIDSIKRVEILSAFEEKMPGLPPVSPEIMGTLKTLEQIVGHLCNAGPGRAPEPETPERAAHSQGFRGGVSAPPGPEGLKKKVVTRRAWGDDGRRPVTVPADRPVFITADSAGAAEALGNALGAMNMRPVVASPAELLNRGDLPSAGGLILLADAWNADDGRMVMEAFELARRAGAGLQSAARAGGAIFGTVTRLDGGFGFAGGEIAAPYPGALPGLAKTASVEWDGVCCRAVDLSPELDPNAAAGELARIIARPGPVEIGLDAYGPCLLELREAEYPAGSIRLDPGDLVVVTGGAKGVTAAAVQGLAEMVPASFLLLGRSPAPAPEPEWLSGLTAEAEMKRAIFSNWTDGKPKPADVESAYRAYRGAREIQETLEKLRAAGANAIYRSADVRDPAGVRAAVGEARDAFGPVRTVIHGAGRLADRLIVEKTPEQFAAVFDTKVRGMEALLAAVSDDPLRYLLIFSSVAARSGNRGQVDYAMANEALNKMARREARQRPDCRVISFNWGPWDGGMVSPALKKEFIRKGVGLIPVADGVQAMLAEMAGEPGGEVEMVIGAELGAAMKTAAPETGKTAKPYNGLPLAFKREIDPRRLPVTIARQVDGAPTMPFSLMAEWLGHGALHQNPGFFLHGLDNLQLVRDVRLDGLAKIIRLLAGKARRNGEGFEAEVELRDGVPHAPDEIHSSARAVLSDRPRHEPPAFQSRIPLEGSSYPRPTAEVYDRILRIGEELRGIREIRHCTPDGVVAKLASAPAPDRWMENPLRSGWIGDPLVLDAAFQMAALWSVEQTGREAAPRFGAAYRQYVDRFPESGVTAVFEIGERGDSAISGDFAFLDDSGAVVASLRGFEAELVG